MRLDESPGEAGRAGVRRLRPGFRAGGIPGQARNCHWRQPISILRSSLISGRMRFRTAAMKSEESSKSRDDFFPATHWSQVVEAGRDSSPGAREAFGGLYRSYAGPLLAFLRSRGSGLAEAEDLLQGFFEFLLTKKGLSKVDRRGRFRSWLLVSLKHYVSNVRQKGRAAMRGGGQPHLALDGEEDAPGVQAADSKRTPDEEYDRQFALRFLELVRERLEQEYRLQGKHELYTCLRPFLLEKKGGQSHAEIGLTLGMSEANVSQSISRLRERYRAIFDDELKKLAGMDGDLEEEKRLLFQALTK